MPSVACSRLSWSGPKQRRARSGAGKQKRRLSGVEKGSELFYIIVLTPFPARSRREQPVAAQFSAKRRNVQKTNETLERTEAGWGTGKGLAPKSSNRAMKRCISEISALTYSEASKSE